VNGQAGFNVLLNTGCQCTHQSLNLYQLVLVFDLPGRHRLHSCSSHRLQVPAYRIATVDRRSFKVAASILWDSLPPDIYSAASRTDFCQKLKTCLFHQSFPDILLYPHIDFTFVDFVMIPVILTTLKMLI